MDMFIGHSTCCKNVHPCPLGPKDTLWLSPTFCPLVCMSIGHNVRLLCPIYCTQLPNAAWQLRLYLYRSLGTMDTMAQWPNGPMAQWPNGHNIQNGRPMNISDTMDVRWTQWAQCTQCTSNGHNGTNIHNGHNERPMDIMYTVDTMDVHLLWPDDPLIKLLFYFKQ